jgi:excisionase family DNA binding protein
MRSKLAEEDAGLILEGQSDRDASNNVELVSVATAAREWNVSTSFIYSLMASGRLSWVKLARCRRIRRASMEELIQRNTFGGWAVKE